MTDTIMKLHIDARHDALLIKDLSGIVEGDEWGAGLTAGGMLELIFDTENTDAVLAAIEGHDAAWLARAKALALQALADRRWSACQTFTYDGVRTAADPALTAVTGYVVAAQIQAPDGPTTWKLGQGHFRQWTLQDIIAYGIAIRTYVQACFDREQALSDAIEAAPDKDTLAAIEIGTGWPE